MPFKRGKRNLDIAAKGGRAGGPARAASLTAERRREIARKAVEARWAKARKGKIDADKK